MTDDHAPPEEIPPWCSSYRVTYWRASKPQPIWEVFGTEAEARRFAKKAARFKESGRGGRVLAVEISERIVTAWRTIDRRDIVDEVIDTSTPHLYRAGRRITNNGGIHERCTPRR